MKKIVFRFLPVLVTLLITLSCTKEKEKTKPEVAVKPLEVELPDSVYATFFEKTAHACVINIEQTDVGMKKGRTPEFRFFSATVNQQHKVLLTELVALGDSKKIPVADTIPAARKKRITSFDPANEQEYDLRLANRIGAQLRTELKALKSVEASNDTDIKVFVARYMPGIETSLDSLRSLRKSKLSATRAVRKKRSRKK